MYNRAMQPKAYSAFPDGLVIYQIYPRSFKDSNGDGIGDLGGIISKLDYLADLGVSALWICPIYPSPMVDFGYDVADYLNVDPSFGTLAELDELITKAHQKNIRIILDLVLNHTSDKHPWFTESKASIASPRRNWYVWKKGRVGNLPPNNWLSTFGGSAWEVDEATNEYYLHSFFKEQPDLNWDNPEVRAAIKDVMRFWLKRGIDGFRLDAVYWYGKDPSFQDDPLNPAYKPRTENPYDALLHTHSKRQGSVFIYLSEVADVLTEFDNRFMVTEAYPHEPFNVESYMEFYERVNSAVAAPFNFMSTYLPWVAPGYQYFINRFQAALKPHHKPVYVYGNHDRTRLATRIGQKATKSAALLQLMLPGVAVIYYGEEIGMEDGQIPQTTVQDKFEKNVPGLKMGRDAERTPMQWNTGTNAGFSDAQPWLDTNSNYHNHNVESELNDPDSLLNFYKKLLAFRAGSDVIKLGTYQPLQFSKSDVLGFSREYQGQKLAVIINFSATASVPLEVGGKILVSSEANPSPSVLKPCEGRVVELA